MAISVSEALNSGHVPISFPEAGSSKINWTSAYLSSDLLLVD